jgi:iron-sulfur cluster repair protein YtfE (RIC family)
MKRHESLIPLTHDHHHALAQVRHMRTAAAGSAEVRLGTAREFLGFFRDETIAHFREEEEVVFPLLVEKADARGILETVMFEHLQLHALVAELRGEAATGSVSDTTLLRVASLLEGHIRFEEKVVFPLAQAFRKNALDLVTLQPRRREPAQSAAS